MKPAKEFRQDDAINLLARCWRQNLASAMRSAILCVAAEAPCEERSLALDRLRAAFVVALLGATAFGLAACGRNGPLEPPPGPAAGVSPTASAVPPSAPASVIGGPFANGPTAQETAMKNGFDAYGNPVAPPGQKRSFILDPLLQ
jgi:predicted small lipoprotein YifL